MKLIYLILLLLIPPFLFIHGDGIRILPQSLTVTDDSVRIDMKISATGIRIPSDESLTLLPSLHLGKKKVELPPIVLSGTRRARFDRREETVNPDRNKPLPYHTWIGVKRGADYLLRYQVSIPYASWMEHAALRLKQISKDCCTERILADDVLTKDINLPSLCAPQSEPSKVASTPPHQVQESVRIVYSPIPADDTTVQTMPELPELPEPLVLTETTVVRKEYTAAVTLHMDYPRGVSKIDPEFGRNRRELLKVDSLLIPLLGNSHIHVKEIRVTGYASPDGAYYDNEALAKNRSQGFRNYLTRLYGLENYPLRTAWIAEDWEGLRRLIRGKPYEKAASFIIDNYGIFEGRERFLMDLSDGQPYKEMLHELFPQLRRIEINIIYEERDEK